MFQYDRPLPIGGVCSGDAANNRQHESSTALHANGTSSRGPYEGILPNESITNQVLRAVTTYKSLVGYVSTTLLSRLITKKVWTNPQLWVGFMRCAKTIAPASFSALMQLPREQLKEILDKQPEMKPGLWQYVLAKNGPVKAQAYADVSHDAGTGTSAFTD